MFYVYSYLRENGTPYYIGKGSGNRAFIKRRRGVKPPADTNRIKILYEYEVESEAFQKEIELIAQYGLKVNGGLLLNQTTGGEGVSRKLRPEEIEARRKQMLGNQINKGRKLTEEHKRNISEGNKGKQRPPVSEETRRKISESLLGTARRAIPCEYKGMKFSSIRNLAKYLGVSNTTARRRLGI